MRIAVIGATGHTGRFVLEALHARGARVVACGRNDAKLAELSGSVEEIRHVDARDEAQVLPVLREVDGVVNLAGPFARVGDGVVHAAITARVPYVDTTGEQSFMFEVRHHHDEEAREAAVAVVNGLAYEYALSDLVVADRIPRGARELHVLYHGGGAGASAGTKRSAAGIMGDIGRDFTGGVLRRVPTGWCRRDFHTDAGLRTGFSIPGGECLQVPRHTPFEMVRTYLPSSRADLARVAGLVGPLAVNRFTRSLVEGVAVRGHADPDNAEAKARVRIVTVDPNRHLVVEVGDPYRLTGELAAEGIVRLVIDKCRGVLSPAEALPADKVIEALRSRLPGFAIREKPAAAAEVDESLTPARP